MGKSKVMRCSRDVAVRLNGELLEEVDFIKYLGSEVTVDLRRVWVNY